MISYLRNIAIIAHVDHGKTTLVDQLLKQSNTLDARKVVPDRVMDSNDLERERGITILAKNTAIRWGEWRINIVDTPGHADFGGEVERVLSMVDSVLLLVDAVDGPMPQTRCVTQKAFQHGLRPIVVINKIDRDEARPGWVLDQTFDLFDRLGATHEQLDFPVVYTSALRGYASLDPEHRGGNMQALFEAIVRHCPPPKVDAEGPLQLQVSQLDYSSYVGTIGIGRITRGTIRRNMPVAIVDRDGNSRPERIGQVLGFLGLDRVEVEEASAGDIVAFAGIAAPKISDTICDPEHIDPLPTLVVDEPTISMTFETNTSPFFGKEGKFVTSRQLRDRLFRELERNVALRVEPTESPDTHAVSGRGELHLGILMETMRREGYEFQVSRPRVITKLGPEGERLEPYEELTVDVPEEYMGVVMEKLGPRRSELTEMKNPGQGTVRLTFRIPARGLFGYRSDFLTDTRGTGIMHHRFLDYGPWAGPLAGRKRGVMVADREGTVVAYALGNLQERAQMFVAPGDLVYEGMIAGESSRPGDMDVNVTKEKKLTNMRASGSDENILLEPPREITLEYALEYIEEDELIEVTPKSIRLRKRVLQANDRRKAARAARVADAS